MKQKETTLKAIVEQIYGIGYANSVNINVLGEHHEELMRVYRSLGGILSEIPFRFGGWDIVTPHFVIELDEEQHFNRYRKQTLDSAIYKDLKMFNVASYRIFCDKFENICLKKAARGGYWANSSTEGQFGTAGPNGELTGKGSPRWKQRAFYDFCRDIYGMATQIPVYRLSIYDEVKTNFGTTTLANALDRNMLQEIESFLKTKIRG
ncbi:MAG: hypothetical protein IH598_00790 [Bacteroidales bacterium]|nr:hypothetical protein [Bacteroidales bacterium]